MREDFGTCEHEKGKLYGGKLCYAELREPTDAYEWSFVAVPSQKKAGVMKKFEKDEGLEKLLRRSGGDRCVREYEKLKRQAELGRKYIDGLRAELVRLAMMSDGELDCEIYKGIAAKLDEDELAEMKRAYGRRAEALFPPETQLSKNTAKPEYEEKTSFLI
jgi:hypothetical protein